MAQSWSAVAKADSTQPKATRAESAAGAPVPQQRSAPAPHISVRIGDVDITIDGDKLAAQFPLHIPREPDFWRAQYREYRRRKAGRPREEEAPAPSPAAKPKPKPASWAALLRPSWAALLRPSGAGGAARAATNGRPAGEGPGGRQFTSLEDALAHWTVGFNAPAVRPRGLVNTGNMCFMNVVLQALLYCAPFRSMLGSIKGSVAFSFKASTPLLEALIQYVHEFKHDKSSAEQLLQLQEALEEPFVPENVYGALQEKGAFLTLRGQQEDAQEFMSYLVDGIHEEMALALQARRAPTAAPAPAAEPDAGGWLEVGPDNRGVHMRDAGESAARTPITQIFGGALRSTLTVPQAGGGRARALHSSTREPFRWLALDVSAAGVATVEDALDELVAPESIEGYVNVQGESVHVTKQILLERMPPVLVLHLKRFVFCADAGVQKVHKFIEYPAVLALAPNWLARTPEAAQLRRARYTLSGVIYHHGSHASGGHYTCDILRSADEWLRFDDIDIACLDSVDDVLAEKKDRTAYILFYSIAS